jgi:hypothetical protein
LRDAVPGHHCLHVRHVPANDNRFVDGSCRSAFLNRLSPPLERFTRSPMHLLSQLRSVFLTALLLSAASAQTADPFAGIRIARPGLRQGS